MPKKRPDSGFDGRSRNKGRPKKMTDCLKRNIIRQIPFVRKKYGTNYGVKEILIFANVPQDISNRTVRWVLYDAGFGLKSARQKGVLTVDKSILLILSKLSSVLRAFHRIYFALRQRYTRVTGN